MTAERIERIKNLIKKSINPEYLEVIDDSEKHAGHPGAQSGLGHFTVRVSSNELKGKSRIQQHRDIYRALGDMMTTDIHALTIDIIEKE